MAEFIAEATASRGGARRPRVAFGHVGDGNVHFDVLQPAGDGARATRLREEGSRAVHDLAHAFGRLVLAEHGLGVSSPPRRPLQVAAESPRSRHPSALDPGIMNPRVLF
jgi:FAD/FMN-containing dehydrogenase